LEVRVQMLAKLKGQYLTWCDIMMANMPPTPFSSLMQPLACIVSIDWVA
jgi:hypothetical protein